MRLEHPHYLFCGSHKTIKDQYNVHENFEIKNGYPVETSMTVSLFRVRSILSARVAITWSLFEYIVVATFMTYNIHDIHGIHTYIHVVLIKVA